MRAIEGNFNTYWLSLGRGRGGVAHDGQDLKWVYTGRPVLNRVIGARLDEEQAELRIAEIVRRFGAWHAGVTWLTGPTTRPLDLGRRLEAHGFAYQGRWSGMAVELAGFDRTAEGPPGLTIREVADEVTQQNWLEILVPAFGLPRTARRVFRAAAGPAAGGHPDTAWRSYVGYVDGRPAATATLVPGAGVAGIYLVGTLPWARGLGLGTTLTRHALATARTAGYAVAALHATAAVEAFYRRMGFERYCSFGVYRWSPPAPPPRRWLARLRTLWERPHHWHLPPLPGGRGG